MSRWFEHSKLIEIHRLYKEDMIANQDEFVYVTWQERERHRLALAYLERAKKRSETNKRARELQKKQESNLSSAGNHEGDESHHHATLSTLGNNQLENKSQMSFDPQKLAEPKTISYERIVRTITLL